MPNAMRQSVERASLPVIAKLSTLPRLLPFGVMLLLLVGGVVIGGVIGAALTLVAAVLVAWLLYLGWPRLTVTERLMRTAVLALVVAVAVTQLFPHASR